jgi:hypothetical protein
LAAAAVRPSRMLVRIGDIDSVRISEQSRVSSFELKRELTRQQCMSLVELVTIRAVIAN